MFACFVCNGDLLCFRPQIAVRLLAHKIQSPQEWEAVQALTVGSPYLSSYIQLYITLCHLRGV